MDNFNVCGIVCEYNPFHKGHIYQIQKAKERTKADFVIAVMSGNFVQRGEPAIINKWARTEMAIKGGADLVIELPAPFALASAEFFAHGAVNILKSTGIVTHLSFGSESFDGKNGAEKIAEKKKKDVEIDKNILEKGLSYAAAVKNEMDILPNDMLGIEYARAANRMNFYPVIEPIKRVGSNHDMKGSAKYIRNSIVLKENNNGDIDYDLISNLMPDFAAEILIKEFKEGRGPVFTENIENIILADLRRKRPEDIRNCAYVSEGIEYKIISEAMKNNSFVEIVKACTSKRYTSSRIRRIIFAALLGIDKNIIKKDVPYIRVLGMNKKAGELVTAIKERATKPIIISKAEFLKKYYADNRCENADIIDFLNIENNATEIYSLGYQSKKQRVGASEMTHPLVFLERN